MLYEEWEKNDEDKIPEDELPYGHPDRPQKSFKLEDINPSDPESIKRATKLNKNVIVVATLIPIRTLLLPVSVLTRITALTAAFVVVAVSIGTSKGF